MSLDLPGVTSLKGGESSKDLGESILPNEGSLDIITFVSTTNGTRTLWNVPICDSPLALDLPNVSIITGVENFDFDGKLEGNSDQVLPDGVTTRDLKVDTKLKTKTRFGPPSNIMQK